MGIDMVKQFKKIGKSAFDFKLVSYLFFFVFSEQRIWKRNSSFFDEETQILRSEASVTVLRCSGDPHQIKSRNGAGLSTVSLMIKVCVHIDLYQNTNLMGTLKKVKKSHYFNKYLIVLKTLLRFVLWIFFQVV